uniref:Putative endonuclease-reverse transcriptase n=1 Tax=Rhipicephalus microplus TaxID=6941 RepID=A0A6M2CRQ2_RHIMP
MFCFFFFFFCVCMAFECIDIVHCLLLLLSGDIESNPGPPNDSAVILAELKNISSGQAKLLSEVQDLKTQLNTTEKTISDLSNRITQLEKHYQSLSTVQTQITVLETSAGTTARHIQTLEARFDDAENRSQRNNLIFYGLPDTNHSETFSESEELIVSLCSKHLNIKIDTKEVERAHRLGRHKPGQHRPVIVKFTSFKTKETILSNGKKLKGTTHEIGQDFSRSVQNARKHLIAFARSKSVAFSCPCKTLFLGSKRYVFDEMSQSIKEMA